jgi:septal ring factor EnvC (AmiA/AmiB activator)
MPNWIEAIATVFILLFSGISAYVKLNNKVTQKADKDIMANELKEIAVTLGKLESGQSEANEKLDKIDEKLENHIDELNQIKQDLAVLKKEHELRSTCSITH